MAVEFKSKAVENRFDHIIENLEKRGISPEEIKEVFKLTDGMDGVIGKFGYWDLGTLEYGTGSALQTEDGHSNSVPFSVLVKSELDEAFTGERREAALARASGKVIDQPDVVGAPPVAREDEPTIRPSRVLRELGDAPTRYWGRVSRDGKIFAIGGEGVDVYDIRPGASGKIIFTRGSYDPTFNDNHMIFQGDGTWIAAHDFLLDKLEREPNLVVEGPVDGFVQRTGSLQLYQDTATGEEGDISIDGYNWTGDPSPSASNPGIGGSPNGIVRFHRQSGIGDPQLPPQTTVISTPYHTGFQLSHDGDHVVCRLADPSNRSQQIGYAVYKINHEEHGVRLDIVRIIPNLIGGKPKMIGEYMVFHHAMTQNDYAEYGFESPDDPGFQELLNAGTADIYAYNIRTNKLRRVTDAGSGQFAWFPSLYRDPNGGIELVYLQRNANGTKSVMGVTVEDPPGTPKLDSWDADTQTRYSRAVADYLENNKNLIPHHVAWHHVNGPGGTRGEGSGIAFLSMHRRMIQKMEKYFKSNGQAPLVPLTDWAPSEAIPETLGTPERATNTPSLETPSWLTLAGGDLASPIYNYTHLSDFKNPDELGQALGNGKPNNLGYHGGGHAAVGGWMFNGRAPEDPVFWLWHKHIDNILGRWLSTANGQAWLATIEGSQWMRSMQGPAPHDPDVHAFAMELVALRESDPEEYIRRLESSSPFEPRLEPGDVEVLQRWPIEALGIEVQSIAQDLSVPWAIDFATDGRIFFTEREGRVRVFENGRLKAEPIWTAPTAQQGTGGLMGIATDPNFSENNHIYTYYTYEPSPGAALVNKVSRHTVTAEGLTDETVIVDGIPSSVGINGGRIAFGPDKKLYISTGVGADTSKAQDLSALDGKILRINTDGSAPDDNPFVEQADADARIYSYGHRNVQGMTWDDTGRFIVSEFGARSKDEINIIQAGKNYGWPISEGGSHQPGHEAPWAHSGSDPSWAPSGIAYFNNEAYPEAWQKNLYVAMLGFSAGNARGLLEFDANTPAEQRTLLQDLFGRIRAMKVGPDGRLYFTTSNRDGRGTPATGDDKILRIVPLEGPQPEPEVPFARVKEILDAIIRRWVEQVGEEPRLEAVHGAGTGWATKEQLLNSVTAGRRWIEPDKIGNGQGNDTMLVNILRRSFGGFNQMPSGGPFLAEEEVQEIAQWIDDGCPD